MSAPAQRGTLYVVATPIGNLEDITLRALRVLKEVSAIACEDTRHTQKLLAHFDIHTPTVSYHEHNERERAGEIVARLERGESVALVSDAGMPGISDPGYRVVEAAAAGGLPVVPIPGASAAISALAASGLPTDSFRFGGFLPAKPGQRNGVLESLKDESATLVFYEAPHRIVEALQDVVETLGPSRRVVIARELTKLHEEFLRGRAADVLAELQSRGEVKGEITLLIGKADPEEPKSESPRTIRQRLKELLASMDEKSALKQAAKEFGISKSEAYRELQRMK